MCKLKGYYSQKPQVPKTGHPAKIIEENPGNPLILKIPVQTMTKMAVRRKISTNILSNELVFTTSRSSGPGGQNVNKVNSKVTLQFDVIGSEVLTHEEKEIISGKLSSRMTREGVLMLTAQDKRSQLQNKEAVILKLEKLLAKAFEKKKVRKATKPSKGSIQDRIKQKKQLSEKKKWRQKPL